LGIEVWYQRAISFHGFTTGDDPPFELAADDLERTHVRLGVVAYPDGTLPHLEWLWKELQGEFYSSEGEARPLIAAAGLHHTSMSTGDLFVLPDDDAFVVAFVGFRPGRITRERS
jgi:hypothetical protein